MEGPHIWQLVDQVVLDRRAYELKAAGDDDVPVYVLLQRRDLGKHVALEDCRVVPGGIGEGRGHDVLGHAVQPVGHLAAARWPPRGEPLAASPATRPARAAATRVEEHDAVHEHGPASEQVSRSPSEKQQAAEGERVGAQHPLQTLPGKARPGPGRGGATIVIVPSGSTMNGAPPGRASARGARDLTQRSLVGRRPRRRNDRSGLSPLRRSHPRAAGPGSTCPRRRRRTSRGDPNNQLIPGCEPGTAARSTPPPLPNSRFRLVMHAPLSRWLTISATTERDDLRAQGRRSRRPSATT